MGAIGVWCGAVAVLSVALALGGCDRVGLRGSGGSASRPDVGVTISLPLLKRGSASGQAADEAKEKPASDP